MNKRNVLLLGVILVLIGVFSSFQGFFRVRTSHFALLAGGCALLLLYRNKKKTWSLAAGLYMVYIGAISLIRQVLPQRADGLIGTLTGAMFFIVPGLIFLIEYAKKSRKGAIYPASFMLWLGVYIILTNLPFFRGLALPLFLICAGLAFMFIYIVTRRSVHRGILYTGVILSALGAGQCLTRVSWNWAASGLIALIGIIVILSAKRQGRSGNGQNGPKEDEDFIEF